MLDTNTVSYITRGRSVAARTRLDALKSPFRPCISAITEGEIRFGLARRPVSGAVRVLIEEFVAKLTVLSWTSQEASVYGELRAELGASGKALGTMDMLIAAHAISIGAILVTSDKAFLHVQKLRGIEDWATDLG